MASVAHFHRKTPANDWPRGRPDVGETLAAQIILIQDEGCAPNQRPEACPHARFPTRLQQRSFLSSPALKTDLRPARRWCRWQGGGREGATCWPVYLKIFSRSFCRAIPATKAQSMNKPKIPSYTSTQGNTGKQSSKNLYCFRPYLDKNEMAEEAWTA